jgi:hypothetical protein
VDPLFWRSGSLVKLCYPSIGHIEVGVCWAKVCGCRVGVGVFLDDFLFMCPSVNGITYEEAVDTLKVCGEAAQATCLRTLKTGRLAIRVEDLLSACKIFCEQCCLITGFFSATIVSMSKVSQQIDQKISGGAPPMHTRNIN